MAERNLSIRLSVVDGGKVKAELSEIGEKGERSLKKIEAAATPASSGLKLLSSAANDAKFQLQAATDRLGMLGSVLGKLGPAGLLAGVSIAALGVGITALVMPVARVGDEFFKLSQKTGVSVEALTALDYAAKLSDVSTEGMTKALQKLSVAMFDTQINGVEGSAALRALGVSATDVNGQIRPTEQVLLDLADKFSAMPDGADKAALAVKLFGKEGLSIIPFLNQGRAGITALMEEAQRLGLVMSEDVARASEVFNDNLTRLSAIFEGVQRQIGAAVIPVLADFTEQVILAQGETGSFSNELQRITSNREATLGFLESVASGLAFIAESAVLAKRVIAQPFDSLSVVGKDIETWFKTDLLRSMKSMGYDPKVIDAEIAKLQGARDDYVRAANDRLFNINQNPGYVDRVQKFFDEQRRTVRVMGQKFVLDTEAQAKEVQAIYDKFLPTLPRKPRPSLDLSGFEKPKPAEKLNEGEAFLNQLRARLTRTQDGEAAELRARALQIEAKGYQGVAAQAEQYIQVLEAIERQKEKDKAFDAYEKEETSSRKITEGLIGSNRQRIEALQLQREMLDLSDTERAVLQARTDLEKAAAAARKEANQLEDAGLRVQTLEAINDALARLRQAASEQHIDVNVAAAAEVRISSEMLPLVEQGKLPFIGQYQGRNVVLLELPHSHIPPGSDKLLAWLGRKNISVMLAHPERNRDLLAAPEQIKPFIKAGCLFQLTAGALDGDMGPDVMALARHWLKQGVYHIIASDTHSVKRRPPKLGQAFEYVKQVQGEEQAHRLCVSNPAELSAPVFERGMLLS